MVEINAINVRRFVICWRGRRTDNGRQKARNHGYDVIVEAESYLLVLSLIADFIA